MTNGFRGPSLRVMVLWLLAMLLMGVFAACGGASAAGIPTASDSRAAPSGEANAAQAETTPAAQDAADAALTFSQCMREKGVSNFPDADAQGRILISPPGSVDPNSAEFQQASEACRHLAPEGWGDEEADPGDAEVMLEFARCMRENGVSDYPDPDPNAGVRLLLDPNDPKAQAAMEACKAILQDLRSGPRIGG